MEACSRACTRDEVLDRIHEPPPWFDVLRPDEAAVLRDLLAKLVEAAAARG
jgi:hypothetical protein